MSIYKLKIYAKMTGIILLLLVVLIFIASNRETVTVKFLGWVIWQAPLFAFILAAAGMGVAVYLVSRKIRKVLKEYREMRREEKTRRKLVDQVKKEVKPEP